MFLLIFTFILQVVFTKEGTLLYTFNFQFGMYHLFMCAAILLVYFFTKKYIPLKILYLLLAIVGVFGVQLIHFDNFVWGTYNFLVYDAGLIKGGFIFTRIVLMVGITSLLTFSTMSIDINNGLQSLLSPLAYIKVPVGVIAMIFSLTLRFIPLLYDETNKIMKAQASRGVDFSEGNLKDKITQVISLLIPMFVISFNKAEDLANAMETRGYVIGAKRSRLDLLKFAFRDYFALTISLLFLTGVILINVL